jgi:ribonuclease VapC
VNVVPESYTFDSEAILAFYLDEEGADVMEECLVQVQSGAVEGCINIINLTEIYYILSRVSPDLAEETERKMRLLGLKVVPVDDDGLWREAARIKAKHSLSLADAFAVATAGILKSKLVVGSDSEFGKLDIQLLRIRGQRG